MEQSLRALGVDDDDHVAVACSGGADSIALLHLLVRAPIRLALTVVHVDHGLRPDSGTDATFVATEAERLGLECRVVEVAVGRRSRESIEAAARAARYSALEDTRAELDWKWLATAHTLDDQAETVLLRLMRGGSLGSIASMRGSVIRPLLDVTRDELRRWLRDQRIDWREDPTNADLSLERNWVRAQLVPLLRSRRAGVAKVLARVADTARIDEEALDALTEEHFQRADVDDAGVFLPAIDVPRALRIRLARAALRRVGIDPTWTELTAVERLRPGGRVACRGVTVHRLVDGLAFVREPLAIPASLRLPAEGVVEASAWGVRVRVGPADAQAWAWRSPLVGDVPAVLRPRRRGERVRTRTGSRKVQDVLVDAKVPSAFRDLVPVMACGRDALAVVALTSYPGASSRVVDVEPSSTTWSRKVLWTRASA